MTPIALAALGISLTETAGVIHLAAEGIMLMSALISVMITFYTGSPWLGLVAGIGSGVVLGSIMGVLSAYSRANQVVVGFGINFLALGLTPLLLERIWGNRGRSDSVEHLPLIGATSLKSIPLVGEVLDDQSIMVFVMVGLMILLWVVLRNTVPGFHVRMAGEHPAAAATAGIRVQRLRFTCALLGSAICGIAGVALSLGQLGMFGRNMTAGRGFIAVAANVVGGWQPIGAVAASALFGAGEAIQLRFQGGVLPNHFVQMLPFVLTIVVVSRLGGTRPPASLGIAYDPERR